MPFNGRLNQSVGTTRRKVSTILEDGFEKTDAGCHRAKVVLHIWKSPRCDFVGN